MEEMEEEEMNISSPDPEDTNSETKLKNLFNFWNGDKYTGQFSVVKSKEKLVMEGEGIYETSDNQIYQGVWKNDGLKKARKIIFPDETEFSGYLEQMKIQGEGKYRFRENVEIEGNFWNNNLIGKIFLRDPNSNLWTAEVDDDEEMFAYFYPLHPFWQSVLNLPIEEHMFYLEAYGEEDEQSFPYE